MSEINDRRPLRTRTQGWVHKSTLLLLKTGITPNQVSLLSIVFAVGGATAFFFSHDHPILLLGAIAGIQLRLIANMMDGLLAIEGGRATSSGPLYNEVPDRFTDMLLLASAGYATGSSVGIIAGWLAVCGALMTACIRMHGASLTSGTHDFGGPFAKPQRMFALTVAALLTLVTGHWIILTVSLVLIATGTYLTFFLRTQRLAKKLAKKPEVAS